MSLIGKLTTYVSDAIMDPRRGWSGTDSFIWGMLVRYHNSLIHCRGLIDHGAFKSVEVPFVTWLTLGLLLSIVLVGVGAGSSGPATGRRRAGWASRVADINTITRSAGSGAQVSSGGTSYFSAVDALHGVELWKSDGTAAGTVMVKDINPGGLTLDPVPARDHRQHACTSGPTTA